MAVKFNKRTRLYLILIGLAVLLTAVLMLSQARRTIVNEKDLSCKSPLYSRTQVDMTKDQVIELWGSPSSVRVKDSTDQNFFYQGANEAEIKEGWMYRAVGQPDAIEIYFNSSGLVNGKNCGQG